MNLFKKISKKFETPQVPSTVTKQETPTNKIKYDFVQEYTLIDPKKLLVNYDYWELCEKTPVAYENGAQDSGWQKCVPLDTSVVLPFLKALKLSPSADIDPKKMRTVSVVHITDDIDIYILPVLPLCKREENCWMYWVNSKQRTKENSFPKGWFFHMTPDIRKAIAAQMKVYS